MEYILVLVGLVGFVSGIVMFNGTAVILGACCMMVAGYVHDGGR